MKTGATLLGAGKLSLENVFKLNNVILSEFSEGQSADGVPIQANVMIEKWHDAYPQAANPRPEYTGVKSKVPGSSQCI